MVSCQLDTAIQYVSQLVKLVKCQTLLTEQILSLLHNVIQLE